MAEGAITSVRPGKSFGFGNWLQPIITANDPPSPESSPPSLNIAPEPQSAPARRGRGRPRVTKPRNDSAVEKRRAQVREAQRAYQKRKDTATATEKRRTDVLLQLLQDLSGDVESLLQAASNSGHLDRSDDVSMKIQRLWTTYNTVISSEHVQPELQQLKVQNGNRQAVQDAREKDVALVQDDVQPERSLMGDEMNDFDFELGRIEGTTVMASFKQTPATERYMAGRSILDIIKERQAAMKEADRRVRAS